MSEILLDQRDFPAGSGELIRGAQETAQNVAEALAIPYGSLPWGRPPVVPREQTAGSHLWSMLNDQRDPLEIIAEVRRVIRSVRSVLPSSARCRYDAPRNRYMASFVPVGERRVITIAVPVPAV